MIGKGLRYTVKCAAEERLGGSTLTGIMDDLCKHEMIQQALMDRTITPAEAAALVFDSLEEKAVSAIKEFRRQTELEFARKLEGGRYRPATKPWRGIVTSHSTAD